MRRRWIALLGAALLAIFAFADLARAMAAVDAGPEIRGALDDPPAAALIASTSRAMPAIEPPSRDGRTVVRGLRPSLVVARALRETGRPAARGEMPRFRRLRFAPREDASADPH